MIRLTVVMIAGALLGASAPVLPSLNLAHTGPHDGPVPHLALTNVTVIDGTGAPPRPGMTVVLNDDRIQDIFPTGERPVPSSARLLDLTGQYLIPGLINTHFHLPMLGWTRDSVMLGLERMLYSGVTTIRELAGDTRLSAEVVRAGLMRERPIPSVYYSVRMAGPSFYAGGAGSRAWIGYDAGSAPWAQAVTAETDIARAVAMAAGTGATGIKLYADLDADLVERIVAEAHRQGLRTWAHGTVFPTNALEAVRAGIDGLSHICFIFWGLEPGAADRMGARRPFDPEAVDLMAPAYQELFREMSQRGIVFDVTASAASRNPGAIRAGCTPDLLRSALLAAHGAGVLISTGTDYSIGEGEPDPTLFTEIEYLVEIGVLSPLEALTAATLNGARALGIDEHYGTVEVGKVADLVVLSSDPTRDVAALRQVEAVVKAGRLHEPPGGKGGALPEAVREELVRLGAEDQAARHDLSPERMQDTVFLKAMLRGDSLRSARLRVIVEEYGWPDPARVGEEAAGAAFLILQHSPDPEFQERLLPVLEDLAAGGEVPRSDAAMLIDRVLVHQNRPQRYGTQFNMVDGRWVLHPVEDEAGLEERRRAMGLPTMEEYMAMLEEHTNMPVVRER